jgi:hypothetical protein
MSRTLTVRSTEAYVNPDVPLSIPRRPIDAEAARIAADLAAMNAPPLGDKHAWEKWEHREAKQIARRLKHEAIEEKFAAAGMK